MLSWTKILSTSIYDLVLIYVCHFHHHPHLTFLKKTNQSPTRKKVKIPKPDKLKLCNLLSILFYTYIPNTHDLILISQMNSLIKVKSFELTSARISTKPLSTSRRCSVHSVKTWYLAYLRITLCKILHSSG